MCNPRCILHWLTLNIVSQNIDLTEKDEEDIIRKKKKTLAASKAIVQAFDLLAKRLCINVSC